MKQSFLLFTKRIAIPTVAERSIIRADTHALR